MFRPTFALNAVGTNLTAKHFSGIAARLRMLFNGAAVQTLGTEAAAHFRMDGTTVPFS